MGWKKRKNAPQDIETVHSLEEVLGKPLNSLLHSKEVHLKNELNKTKQETVNLVVENTCLKQKLEKIDSYDDSLNTMEKSAEEKFLFFEVTDPISLRFEGFSNLIDLLIGICMDREADDFTSSTYAEELSYILSDYIYNYSPPELIGFNGKRSIEEIKLYMDEHRNKDDEKASQWILDAIVDSNGNKLYDENGKVMLSGIDLFKKLENGSVFNEYDSLRIRALIDELIKKWDNFVFPYAVLSISIIRNDKEIFRYTYGEGLVHPMHEDRMEIVNDLLSLTNGDISKFAFQNVKKLHVDQFEQEIEIAYDLKDLL